jgi:hypothetical protein
MSHLPHIELGPRHYFQCILYHYENHVSCLCVLLPHAHPDSRLIVFNRSWTARMLRLSIGYIPCSHSTFQASTTRVGFSWRGGLETSAGVEYLPQGTFYINFTSSRGHRPLRMFLHAATRHYITLFSHEMDCHGPGMHT